MSDNQQADRGVPHTDLCDDEGCYCPDDVFWKRMLGDDDPCAPGKDWASAAFNTTDLAREGVVVTALRVGQVVVVRGCAYEVTQVDEEGEPTLRRLGGSAA